MKYGYLESDDITDIKELQSDEILKKRGIYVIVNTVSRKVYVGKTEKTFEYRNNVHSYELYHNCHINKHLQSAWKKYGSEAFIFCIYIESPYENAISDVKRYNEFKKWLDDKEVETIRHFRSILPLNAVYNYNDGGEGGIHPTPELYKKLHDKNVESWKRPSTRKKRIDGIKRKCKINSESGKLSKVQETTWKNSETREKRIKGLKNAYKDPIKKQRHLEGVRAFYKTEEGKEQIRRLHEIKRIKKEQRYLEEKLKNEKILLSNTKLMSIVLR